MKLPFWPNPKGYRDIELGLSRVYDLLKRLDNPHLKLPPTIHIAGTNGKGSTLSFLKSIFVENGYKVHAYTSPHLVEFNERIVLDNKNISDQFLNECLTLCKTAAEMYPVIDVTYFEGITVAAFLAFSKVKGDILLLETGLGGRLDATNVIPFNLLSIICPISYDHTEFLGDTISQIAFEKAGILKQNCPTVIANQQNEALNEINKQAKNLNCQTVIFGQNFKYQKQSQENWIFTDQNGLDHQFSYPSLIGDHQLENAACAIAACFLQDKFTIKNEAINRALKKTIWPARLQKINSGKFYDMLSSNCELYVDGSHNLQGSVTLYNFLQTKKDQEKILIFSMLKDKDADGFIKKISQSCDYLIATTIKDEPKSRSAEEILQICQKYQLASDAKTSLNESFDFAWQLAQTKNKDTIIIICGSLYLAGNFLEENEKTS